MHRLWRWIADRVLPSVSYTSHLHPEHGDHWAWRAEQDGEPLDPFGEVR